MPLPNKGVPHKLRATSGRGGNTGGGKAAEEAGTWSRLDSMALGRKSVHWIEPIPIFQPTHSCPLHRLTPAKT